MVTELYLCSIKTKKIVFTFNICQQKCYTKHTITKDQFCCMLNTQTIMTEMLMTQNK